MLLPWFEWCENTGVGHVIRTSTWVFPVVEVFHLIALAIIGGTILLIDFRLLGLGLRNHPVERLARDVQPWFVGSLVVMLVSGVLLFTSESVKCYYSMPFWIKMWSLLFAILFAFTVRRWVTFAEEGRISPASCRLVATVSIMLWAGVAWGGRWIGFS